MGGKIKVMKLYLVRHGQTDWNVAHLAQGRTDVPLNEIGIMQAKELRDKVRDMKFDACYSSPLERAMETAKIVVDGRCKIIKDNLLVERCFGDYEGRTPPGDWLKYWSFGYNEDSAGMEPLEDVFERTKIFLDKLKKTHAPGDSILVVGHGGTLKTMHYNIVGYDDNTDLMETHFGNGEIWEYEI